MIALHYLFLSPNADVARHWVGVEKINAEN